MAYSKLLPPALTSKAPLAGLQFGQEWYYRSADAASVVDENGYITNGVELGMKVGDKVTVRDTVTNIITSHVVVAVNVDPNPFPSPFPLLFPDPLAGSVDLSDGVVIGSAANGYGLGLASWYAMLAGSSLTLTSFSSPSSIGGNIGETTLAGVAPIFIYGANLGSAGLAAAQADVLALYNMLKILPGNVIPTPAALQADDYGQGAGVFVPGVYTTGAAIGTTAATSMTLSGDGDYVFVSTGGAITFGATFTMFLTNGAKASRVFWVANNAITTGSTDILKGNFMSGVAGAITIGSTNNIEGRLLSPVAITVDGTASNFYLPAP